ncbi:hypothetical protein [Nocardia salmonicida]|uniref:hypothetical protein n=1 Tax=Nocardia salmonicida TaxID=53431 RepID=UPI0007A508A7|nr:hypothetical protein [Nocardia salmonicida]
MHNPRHSQPTTTSIQTPSPTNRPNPTADPDFAFTLRAEPVATAPSDPIADARRTATRLTTSITDIVIAAGPPQWRSLHISTSVTTTTITADAIFTAADNRAVQVEIPTEAIELIQVLRLATIDLRTYPWWYAAIERDNSAMTTYDFGYGEHPFPPERLLPAAAYRADLAVYPRERLPVWLAAHLAVDNGWRVGSTLAAARADPAAVATAVRFLEPTTLFARWSVLAAAAVTVGSEWGPRILGSSAVFEATDGGGATLSLLPRGRAVLSGGLWNARELDDAYHSGHAMPRFFAGAPDWLDLSVLNPRALTGEMSFCYWWDGSGWACGQSPDPTTIGPAIPGMWTPRTVVDIVCAVLGPTAIRSAVATLVEAAEFGTVTREIGRAAFDTTPDAETDTAWGQLALAGVTL